MEKIKVCPVCGFVGYEEDAVEVVRCGECKHYSVEGETTHFGWCGYWNEPTDEMRFCSDGERNDHECVLSR